MLLRFRDPTKIFRDPHFLRYHSPFLLSIHIGISPNHKQTFQIIRFSFQDANSPCTTTPSLQTKSGRFCLIGGGSCLQTRGSDTKSALLFKPLIKVPIHHHLNHYHIPLRCLKYPAVLLLCYASLEQVQQKDCQHLHSLGHH